MLLLESIRIEKGEPLNIDYHQKRMNTSRQKLFHSNDEIDLVSLLKEQLIPKTDSIQKCRIIYNTLVRKVEFIPYKVRKVNSLKLMQCDDIEYDHKYLNREKIDELYSKKGDSDDIIIVKEGFLTDSSFANLLFFDGENWVTPAKPLLQGTQRAKLLSEGRILASRVKPENLRKYSKIRLINAMLRFEDKVDISSSQIFS